jgi:hypothetical protein
MEQRVRPLDWRDSLKPSVIVFVLLAIALFNPFVLFIFLLGNGFSHQFSYPGPGLPTTLAELTTILLVGFLVLDIPLLLILHRRRERAGTYKVPPILLTAFCFLTILALYDWQEYSNKALLEKEEQGRKAVSQRDYEEMRARVRDPAAILSLPRVSFSAGQARALGERLGQNDVTAEEMHAALSAHDCEEVEFGLASNPNTDSDDLVKIATQRFGPPSARVKLAVANNPHTPGDVRRSLLGPAYHSCDPEYLYSLWRFHSNESDTLRGLAENPCTPIYVHIMLVNSPDKALRDAATASEERRRKNSKEERYSADWNQQY